MSEQECWAEQFEQNRSHLRAAAYNWVKGAITFAQHGCACLI
jgi:hypothetical protein